MFLYRLPGGAFLMAALDDHATHMALAREFWPEAWIRAHENYVAMLALFDPAPEADPVAAHWWPWSEEWR